MINPKNNGNIVGRLVSTPEILNDKVARMRIAVDRAGSDRDNPDENTGFFNVTFFLTDDTPGAKFVRNQIENGNFDQGTSLHIVYQLRHENWSDSDNNRRSAVGLIAESITFAGMPAKTQDAESSSGTIPEQF